jgi:hypothetical protein
VAIFNELLLKQSSVSQQSKEHKKAGLFQGIILGITICFYIDEKALKS